MRVALLSDIHSNHFALAAVLGDLQKQAVNQVMILGDIFGYCPWATETIDLLGTLAENTIILKGNHDQLLLEETLPEPVPGYWQAAKQNEAQLRRERPAALAWLRTLAPMRQTQIGDWRVGLYHGTPDDPLNGRYYPDDDRSYPWFPDRQEMIILGHTHHPLVHETQAGGLVVNPGSVGQPRDGNPLPSWVVVDFPAGSVEFRRTAYDWRACAAQLEKMGWYERAILALKKDYRGKLRSGS